jgi:hypothetical protein
MRKLFTLCSLLLFLSGFSFGTSVTATIVSPDGFPYANGTVIATLTPITGTIACNQYKVNGVNMGGSSLPCVVQSTMSGSGTFTITLTDDHTIFPTGSLWAFTVCAQANNSCSTSLQDVYGSTINLSTQINNTLPTIAASAFQYPRLFANPEAAVSGLGSAYYNLTDNTIHLCIANPCSTNTNWISTSGTAVNNMAQGQPVGGGLLATSLDPLNYSIAVSSWCGSSTVCSLYTDECVAIHNIVSTFGAGGVSLHIIDDMTGIQTCSRQPLTGMSGIFEDSHLGYHWMKLDGMSTFEIPNTVHMVGMGGNSNLQNPSNSFIGPCNPALDICFNGGFQAQVGTLTSFVVSGNVATVTVSGTPFDVTTTDLNALQTNRIIHIYGSNVVSENNAWFVKAVTQTTSPQIFTLWVVSGVTGSCNSGCTGTANLETPVVALGTGGGGGAYDAYMDGYVINCHFFPASGGFVQAQGEEETGFGPGGMHIANCMDYYARWDQSGAYGGTASGDTNSMGSGPFSGNINPEYCTKTGGCSCNIGSAGCSTGTVPINTLMSCGGGTSVATISPDPCQNNNFMGLLVTGIANNQGPGRFKGHITISIADKSVGGGSGIPQMVGSGATQGCAFCIAGSTFQFDHLHAEYFATDIDVCGDVSRQASFQEAYNTYNTSGTFNTGFHAFNTGGVGITIGTAGFGSTCTNIRLDSVDFGIGSGNALIDNITGAKCSDAMITYEHGNLTHPIIENTCINTDGSGMSGPVLAINSSALYTSVGTLFTSNNGCSETTLKGGPTYGSFVIGTSSACTISLNFSSLPFSPANGFVCWYSDLTNVPTVAIRQSATTTTGVNLKMTATSGDTIVFGCDGF